MLKKLVTAMFIILAVATAQAASNLTPNETFNAPGKQLDVDSVRKFKGSDTILVPSLYLHTLTEGKYSTSKNGAHAKANFAISNLSPALGAELATIIYKDLVDKLKASGWKVLTFQDVKDHKGWSKLKPAKEHKKLGVPGFDKDLGYGTQYWMTSVPEGTINIALQSFGAPGAADVHNVHTKVAKDIKANLLFPVFRYDGPVGYGSTDRGYKKTRASAGVAPAMDLNYIQSGFYSVKGAWGGVNLKEPVRVSENIGDIEVLEKSASEDVSLFTFETFRTMAKGDYRLTLNEAEYRRAILQSATDYNTLLVEGLKDALP